MRLRRRSAILTAVLAGLQFVQPLMCVADVPRFLRSQTTVEKLAAKIDELQRNIDHYGTVVAKTPDVWGQSRLMQHRVDFENEMRGELNQFQLTLNASEQISDGAFLSSALSFQQALGGAAPPSAPPPGGGTTTTVTPPQYFVAGSIPGITPIEDNVLRRTPMTTPTKFYGRAGELAGVSLEPTLYLDQKKRYLDHLNNLRRINEGDDTADAPGYALNLVRVPVSVFPGKKTEHGYGAEITVSIKPHLTEDLLPNAFRDLVINDVAARLSMPVFKVADEGEIHVFKETLLRLSKGQEFDGVTAYQRFENAFAWVKSQFELQDRSSPRPAGEPSAPPVGQKSYLLGGARPSTPSRNSVVQSAFVSPYSVDNTALGDARVELSKLKHTSVAHVSGTGRRSKLSVSETQQAAVNGITIFRVGVDAFDHLAEPPCESEARDRADAHKRGLNFLDVQAWLRRELQSSHEFLSQPRAACLWNYCGPEMVAAVREHRREVPAGSIYECSLDDEGNLAKIRERFFCDIANEFPQAKDTTTANLAWHIIVESALLNEHLAEDMAQLARTKSCPCQPPACPMFAGPNPPPEARHAFMEYVRCRWPIHVFALDPMTQDQNVGEAFSRRREMQLALALAAGSRRTNLQSVSRFMRRMEYDLQTIELNRTAVGFSHGDDVCGWRFYPRVQAPRVPGNLEVVTREMILGQMDRERMLNDRKLEPGIRECEAIVIMPSFLQFVTVDTRTNWFRLNDKCDHSPFNRVLHREMNVSDAVDLSREMQKVHELSLVCQRDAHKYRDGEANRLLRAVETLDRQLPLQTAMVQMPYENTLGGFEMFSSGVTDLAPELHGWYGAPGVQTVGGNESYLDATAKVQDAAAAATALQAQLLNGMAAGKTGDDLKALQKAATDGQAALNTAVKNQTLASSVNRAGTRLFLVGKNFSVIGTRIVAGGATIVDPNMIRLVNRQILEVTIPAVASAVYVDGKPMIDVHVATPYGVTSHIHIPVANATSPCKSSCPECPDPCAAANAAARELEKATLENDKELAKNTYTYNIGVNWQGRAMATVGSRTADRTSPSATHEAVAQQTPATTNPTTQPRIQQQTAPTFVPAPAFPAIKAPPVQPALRTPAPPEEVPAEAQPKTTSIEEWSPPVLISSPPGPSKPTLTSMPASRPIQSVGSYTRQADADVVRSRAAANEGTALNLPAPPRR